MRSSPLVVLALSLALPLPAQGGREKQAIDALIKAEKLVSKGSYTAAVSAYRRIAKRYKGTTAAALAESRTEETAYLGQSDVLRNGPSENRVDIVIMGDGYRLQDQNDFDDVAKAIPDAMAKNKLLGEYAKYHNYLKANLRSKDQGVSGYGRDKQTALGGHILKTVQGHVAVQTSQVRRYLQEFDIHDGLVIAVVKAGSLGTGGGGIACIGGRADKTMIHEWGHAFGELSDEYTTFTGHRGAARNSINISTSEDPEKAPWAHFIAKKIPGVGTYRGGAGRLKGAWRPTASGCVMQSGEHFCPVCREALVLKIHRFVDPIDGHEPELGKELKGRRKFDFEVVMMEPATHNLAISWWLLGPKEHIRPAPRGPFRDRRKRGPLQKIAARPDRYLHNSGRTRQRFPVDTRKFEPGVYQVVCRVEDRAKPGGQQYPWVLKDPQQLLWSERVWEIEVK